MQRQNARQQACSARVGDVLVEQTEARFPFKRNRLRFSRNKRKRQPIGMLGRSSGNNDWLLANAIACVSCGFRLRNVSDYV